MNAAEKVQAYLDHQQNLDTLRFITCGSVDDGKSTLIGRMLWESQQLFEDQVAALRNESKRYGTQGDNIDFALLVDGLSAEREQGITIDVAYRYFQTDARKFIVADTPGHEQYTRNMVTGASTAHLAVLLIDARKGVLTQTRRHAFLTQLVGIRHLVLAVNKMDLVGFKQEVYDQIVADFAEYAKALRIEAVQAIPLSAIGGDNLRERSKNTPWYHGPTLMGYLETVDVLGQVSELVPEQFAMPIQWVNRPNLDFRGFAGLVASGLASPGMPVEVAGKNTQSTVSKIVQFEGDWAQARAGDSITLTLADEVDVSRGDVLCHPALGLKAADQFCASLVWMDPEQGLPAKNYLIQLHTQQLGCSITKIKHKVNVNTLAHEAAEHLETNDIAEVNIHLDRKVVALPFAENKQLGSFILVDRYSNRTVGAGVIHFALKRNEMIHASQAEVSAEDRAKLHGHKGHTVWFVGPADSDKTELAAKFELMLHQERISTMLITGSKVRSDLSMDLGFKDSDKAEHVRRMVSLAKLLMEAGCVAVAATVSKPDLLGEEGFIVVDFNEPSTAGDDLDEFLDGLLSQVKVLIAAK